MRRPLQQLHTAAFLMLVFSGQGNVCLPRERRQCWDSRASAWRMFSSVADVVGVRDQRGPSYQRIRFISSRTCALTCSGTITIAFQFVSMWLGVDEAGTGAVTTALAARLASDPLWSAKHT